MLADQLDYVIGVDTHRDQHVLAIVAAPTGAIIARASVATDRRGYEAALRCAVRHAGGVRVWAVEGTGHYGAGLTRFLASRAEAVSEVGRSARVERRLRGKDDPLDAVRAARSALASDTITRPRASVKRLYACSYSHAAAPSTSAGSRSSSCAA